MAPQAAYLIALDWIRRKTCVLPPSSPEYHFMEYKQSDFEPSLVYGWERTSFYFVGFTITADWPLHIYLSALATALYVEFKEQYWRGAPSPDTINRRWHSPQQPLKINTDVGNRVELSKWRCLQDMINSPVCQLLKKGVRDISRIIFP